MYESTSTYRAKSFFEKHIPHVDVDKRTYQKYMEKVDELEDSYIKTLTGCKKYTKNCSFSIFKLVLLISKTGIPGPPDSI